MKRAWMFAGSLLVSVCADGEMIRLADGREYEGRVLSETDDSITVVIGKTAQKFSKSLLHAETLARHPIPQPIAISDLPPEPSGLEKPGPGRRSITKVMGNATRRWDMSIYLGHEALIVLGFRSWTESPLHPDRDFFLTISPDHYRASLDLMTKALEWKDAAQQAKAPDFEKTLGETPAARWLFSWSRAGARVRVGSQVLSEEDVEAFAHLLNAAAYIAIETREEKMSAAQFAETLK